MTTVLLWIFIFHIIKSTLTIARFFHSFYYIFLQVVEFSEMNQVYVEFIKQILCSILNQNDQIIQTILSKIPKKDAFASAIRLFITCFIDDNIKYKANQLKNLKK